MTRSSPPVSCARSSREYQREPGRADVVNEGRVSLDSVVVHTTGYDYPLGDLGPSDTARVRIQAIGESHVELTHGRGPRTRLQVCGYFERGYRGTMKARLSADSVLSFQQATR